MTATAVSIRGSASTATRATPSSSPAQTRAARASSAYDRDLSGKLSAVRSESGSASAGKSMALTVCPTGPG